MKKIINSHVANWFPIWSIKFYAFWILWNFVFKLLEKEISHLKVHKIAMVSFFIFFFHSFLLPCYFSLSFSFTLLCHFHKIMCFFIFTNTNIKSFHVAQFYYLSYMCTIPRGIQNRSNNPTFIQLYN